MLLSLDFVYIPSKHPDREVAYYTDILGGTLIFRIKEMGTEVSAVRLSEHGPLVLLAEHLEGDVPILIYRVEDLEQEMNALEETRLDARPDA